MNPLAWALVAVGIFLGGLTTGAKVVSWKRDAQDAARVEAGNKAYVKSAEKIDGVSAALEDAIADIGKKRIVVTKEIRHETEKPVYRDCVVPASGVLIYNRASENTAAPGEPEKTLPRPGDLTLKR